MDLGPELVGHFGCEIRIDLGAVQVLLTILRVVSLDVLPRGGDGASKPS